jgi:hypothetical protein
VKKAFAKSINEINKQKTRKSGNLKPGKSNLERLLSII